MRRVLTICLFALAAVLVAAPAALAASGPAPTITRVQPMRVSVGNLLTITGSHFKAQRTRNTVIFRGPNGRTAFAKPRRSTTRKLVVRVPAAVARLLRVSGSRQRPTRLKLRVLSGQFSKFTTRRLSPVVTGVGDGDGGPGGRRRWRRWHRRLQRQRGPRRRPAPEHAGARDRHGPVPGGHRQRPDDGRLGVLVGQGPQHQGRAVPRQAPLPERPRSVGRRSRARAVQQHRLRRRRPHQPRGVPRLALHRQRVRRLEGRRARSRVAARLQRRHAVQPRERDAGRARLAGTVVRAAGSGPAVPGDAQPARRRRMAR